VLQRLCADPALRARLGTAARQTIVARALTWDRNAERVVVIARAALAARGVGTGTAGAEMKPGMPT
jgi:hypothetical protein